MKKEAIAKVGLSCGRYYLKVGPVIVAMEGDPCRDSSYGVLSPQTAGFQHNVWNGDELEKAAKHINTDNTDQHNDILLKIIRMGLTGDIDGVRNYTNFLADKIDGPFAKTLRKYADGDFGAQVLPMEGQSDTKN